MVIYITNPVLSKLPLLDDINRFSWISGYAINHMKTELYPICIPEAFYTEIRLKFSFEWVIKAWHHLGVLIPLLLQDLFSANYN